jgi:hypothetical protein
MQKNFCGSEPGSYLNNKHDNIYKRAKIEAGFKKNYFCSSNKLQMPVLFGQEKLETVSDLAIFLYQYACQTFGSDPKLSVPEPHFLKALATVPPKLWAPCFFGNN